MEPMKTFMYSLLEIEKEAQIATMHNGLAAGPNAEYIHEAILGNYRDPRHISIKEVPELKPVFDDEGNTVAFISRNESYPQVDAAPVDNMEGTKDAPKD